ncbi:MAG: tRNA epoxyqueuosine(34) reductase QueG, partial [Ignavibacteriae bacterium]|nr:tRNA epoxyqueuosine(34) reductase QueG [Ignavibacteriota bacterium]
KEICLKEGFIKAGIARAEKLEDQSLLLKQWIDEGRNADMKWIDKGFEKRRDASLIMEDIKSVISLAYLYDTPFNHSDAPRIPKISRYAWGEKDYHKVLKKKLKKVCAEIDSLSPEIKTRAYVDDGPVMDKAWAVRSGIGWMGKHSNVINSEFGSFFFISEILINIELKPDEPAEELCGSCSICMQACPTGAIYEEYRVDASLCISYHTIENRGEIPDYIDLNDWIFGCDICQDVCPYNKKKYFTEDTAFFPKMKFLNKPREDLLKLTEEEFNAEFTGTPVKRTKYTGWRRNLLKA